MKRVILLLLAALLALSLAGAAAEGGETTAIAFPELKFTTLADFDCVAQAEGDELFIYTGQPERMPYFYIFLNDGDDRVTDGNAYINDVYIPGIREDYGANGGMMFSQHGDFSLGGRAMPNVEMEFRTKSGGKVYGIVAFDVQERYTVNYTAYFADPALRDTMLAGLETLAANLEYTPGGQAAEPEDRPVEAPTATDEPFNFVVTDINYGGMTVGRCTAPAGWQASGTVSFGNNIEASWLLGVKADAPDIGSMSYLSQINYLDILRWDGGTGHQDGQHNALLHVDMLHYKDAPAYCDFIAAQLNGGATPVLVEDNQFPDATALLARKERAVVAKGNELSTPSGVKVDWVKCGVCMRRYATEVSGMPICVCVMAGVEAVQSTAAVPGIYNDAVIQTISWCAPFTYTMICPSEEWDRLSPVFIQFVENTGASDQFIACNERLTRELVSIIAGQIDLSSGRSYSENALRKEASGGDDYTDRYSDYLFDQNDYTLSDGSHVKVSTDYDYVYQGDNGNVYYSDSPSAQPGGSTQLYPNR